MVIKMANDNIENLSAPEIEEKILGKIEYRVEAITATKIIVSYENGTLGTYLDMKDEYKDLKIGDVIS